MTVTPVLHGTFSVHKFSVLRSRQLWPPNYSDYHFSARSENIFLRIKLADIYLLWLKVHDGFLDASHGRGAVVKCAVLSCLPLCAKSWMIARQAAPSVELFRQECWSGLPCPSPGDLPNQGPKVRLLHWQQDSLTLRHLGKYESRYYCNVEYVKGWCRASRESEGLKWTPGLSFPPF